MIFTQKYLDRAKYGVGLGKAEKIKEFVSKSKDTEKLIVDEHLSSNKYLILILYALNI